jgi:hypothetical protein
VQSIAVTLPPTVVDRAAAAIDVGAEGDLRAAGLAVDEAEALDGQRRAGAS